LDTGERDPWPAQICVGDQIRFQGLPCVLSSVTGGRLHLSDRFGRTREVSVLEVLSTDVEITACAPSAQATRTPHDIRAVSEEAWEQARFWKQHLSEVISGERPGAVMPPKPQYDPGTTTLAQREAAKAAELSPLLPSGTVSARTVRRKRLRYQSEGFEALLDGRAGRTEPNGARVDPRVLRALLAIGLRQGRTALSGEAWRRAVIFELQQQYPDQMPQVPSRSTIRRIVAKAQASADPGRPEAWGLPADQERIRPGGRVFVDTSVLGVRLAGDVDRIAELNVTVALDEATGSALAVVVHPPGSVADGPALLARMCTPAALLPSLCDTVAGSPPLRPAAAVIRPRQLVIDHGPLSRSTAFRDACRTLGVELVAAGGAARSGWWEARERALIRRLAHDLAGEEGRWTGREAESMAGCAEMQRFVDRWVPDVWQTTPASTRSRLSPDQQWARHFTDEDRCLDLPYDPRTTLALLPSVLRSVTGRGVRVNGCHYNSVVLQEFRSPAFPAADREGKGPEKLRVSFDPADVSRVWIFPSGRGWTEVAAVHDLHGVPRQPRRVPDRAPLANTLSGAARPGSLIQARSLGALAPDRRSRPVREEDYDFWGPPGTPGHRDRLAHHTRILLSRAPLFEAVHRAARTLVLLNTHGHGGHRSLLVTGAPGVGKTTALISFAREFEQRDPRLHPGRSDRVPTLYTRVRPGSSVRQYLADAVQEFGLPAAGRGTAQLCDLLRDALVRHGTGLVMVDEVEWFDPQSSPSAMDVLRFLADQVPAVFVFAGQRAGLGEVSAQARARLTHVHGEPVPPGPLWQGLVADLENQLRLRGHRPGTLTAMAPDLHARTGGSVASLVLLVAHAALRAIDDGSEELTGLLFSPMP